jgi:hypothetical protein
VSVESAGKKDIRTYREVAHQPNKKRDGRECAKVGFTLGGAKRLPAKVLYVTDLSNNNVEEQHTFLLHKSCAKIGERLRVLKRK